MEEMNENRPLILISNDDGVNAKGLRHLVECVADMGEIVVVAPLHQQSAKSSSITEGNALMIKRHEDYSGAKFYSVTGTPVDCVKLAMHAVLDRKPDLMLSGINHGSNSGNSIVYSGTMGAAIEACMLGIDAIGYSFMSFDEDADFAPSTHYIREITAKVIKEGLPQGVCLNVNIPIKDIQGVKVVRSARGYWTEEYSEYKNPYGDPFYMLSGYFKNEEPDSDETDLYWLERRYVTVVPSRADMTAHDMIPEIGKLF